MSTKSLYEVQGRTYLVTGASSGIGQSVAIYLAERGARVVLVARDEARLAATRAAMSGEGHVIAPFDLTRVDEIPTFLKDLAGKIGPLDGVAHCAGIVAIKPLKIFRQADFDSMMRINVGAGLALVRGFRQKGVRNPDAGSVVFLSSVAGLVGDSGIAAYSATKGALISAVRSLCIELAGEKIRVNCVAPGGVAKVPLASNESENMAPAPTESAAEPEKAVAEQTLTPEQLEKLGAKYPLGFGHPKSVSACVAYLLGANSKWISGSTFVVDGGYMAQ